LNRKDVDAYAALGLLAIRTGDYRTARKMMKKAQRFEGPDEYPRLRRLEQQLLDRRRGSS